MRDIDQGRPFELDGSPDKPLRWLIAIMLVPILGVLVGLSLAANHATAQARGPILLGAAVAPLVMILSFIAVLRSLKRAGARVDRDELVINTGFGSKRIPLLALRKNGLRIVDLNERTELKPMLRLWGTSLPGFSGGWFRLRNGEKAVCVLLERSRVSYLRGDDGTSVLLSLREPEKLRTFLER